MISEVDVFAFLAATVCWLGPFFVNLAAGRVNLLHPISFFPIQVVWLMIPPLAYRTGEFTMLNTARMFVQDEWFLAEPMLVIGLTGIIYHVTVRLMGVPLLLRRLDDGRTATGFPLGHRFTTPAVFISCLVVGAGCIFAQILSGDADLPITGYYWLMAIYRAVYILPVLMMAQNQTYGGVLFLLFLPSGLLLRSKAAFLNFAVMTALYFQQRIFRSSKLVIAVLACAIILTPFAVQRYAQWEDATGAQTTGWAEALNQGMGREHAFENFAVIYHSAASGTRTYSGRVVGELAQSIPTFLWPGKPIRLYDIAREFLAQDVLPVNPIKFATYGYSLFYLDFGFMGCCLLSSGMGLLLAVTYSFLTGLSLRREESWPMFFLLTLVYQSRVLLETGPALFVATTIPVLTALSCTLVLASLLSLKKARRKLRSPVLKLG